MSQTETKEESTLPISTDSISEFKKIHRAQMLDAMGKQEANQAEDELIDQIADMKLFKAKYLQECDDKWFKAAADIRKCLKLLHLLSDKPQKTQSKALGSIFEKKKKNNVILIEPTRPSTPPTIEPKADVIAEFWKQRNKKPTVKERREALLKRLGGVCAMCGATERLEFDHIHGATWDVTSYSGRERMDRYEEDEKDGLLRALCRSCNASDGAKNRQGKARWKPAQDPIRICKGCGVEFEWKQTFQKFCTTECKENFRYPKN